jgi:hypothetical protein
MRWWRAAPLPHEILIFKQRQQKRHTIIPQRRQRIPRPQSVTPTLPHPSFTLPHIFHPSFTLTHISPPSFSRNCPPPQGVTPPLPTRKEGPLILSSPANCMREIAMAAPKRQ